MGSLYTVSGSAAGKYATSKKTWLYAGSAWVLPAEGRGELIRGIVARVRDHAEFDCNTGTARSRGAVPKSYKRTSTAHG